MDDLKPLTRLPLLYAPAPPPPGYFVRDLEGVVDALKRVTDKLRGENDRLRRMAGEGGGRAEAERSAREAKKKAASFCYNFFHVFLGKRSYRTYVLVYPSANRLRWSSFQSMLLVWLAGTTVSLELCFCLVGDEKMFSSCPRVQQ